MSRRALAEQALTAAAAIAERLAVLQDAIDKSAAELSAAQDVAVFLAEIVENLKRLAEEAT